MTFCRNVAISIETLPIILFPRLPAGLDAASEKLVLDALNNLMAGRTSIINVHRLATVRRADVIFVLREGIYFAMPFK